MKKIKIYGPPGTGKTRYLVDRIIDYGMEGDFYRCAFISFSRKTIQEARRRIDDATINGPLNLRFITTLHSICYRLLNLTPRYIMGPKDYKAIADHVGYPFYKEGSYYNRYFKLYMMEISNPAMFEEGLTQLDPDLYRRIRKAINRYKIEKVKITFDDILWVYIRGGYPLPVKYAFIDEAQDLTPLEWDACKLLFLHCDVQYVAGDDDQAIYEWAGATPDLFMNMEADETITLDKSYRLPKNIYDYTQRIVSNINVRAEKHFMPADSPTPGYVGTFTDWHNFDFKNTDKPYTILFRENAPMMRLAQRLTSEGVDFGLVKDGSDKKILLGTFHSSKGGEFENVIISHDTTDTINNNLFYNNDYEMRCLYVAATRAKRELWLKCPEDESLPIFDL